LIDLLAVRTERKPIACREQTNEVEQTVRRFAKPLFFHRRPWRRLGAAMR